MANPGDSSAGPCSSPPNGERDLAQRQLLHQLNNIFASIHSSLDLALANADRPEGRSFLVQAQEGARRGARLVNELRFRGRDAVPAVVPALTPQSAPETGAGHTDFGPHPAEARLEGCERILVAEDEESIRMLVRAVLNYRGYQVTEAGDGDEAVQLFQSKGPFDLVILDLRMQKLDGAPALVQLRSLAPQLPALALSGLPFDRPGLDDGSGEDGFDARLNKPFDNTELVKLVRQLLDRRSRSGI